jgi:predicted aldo/keto reductase-like oxidoreductase
MTRRQLGNSDLYITPIGLGSWAIGGGKWEFAWGPQNDKDSIEAIRAGLDLGLNWIDTAAVYGLGHSETIVGRAITSPSRGHSLTRRLPARLSAYEQQNRRDRSPLRPSFNSAKRKWPKSRNGTRSRLCRLKARCSQNYPRHRIEVRSDDSH